MTPEDLARQLADRPPLPAYLIAGSEPLLRDDALAALRTTVLTDGSGDFNFATPISSLKPRIISPSA